MKARIKESLLRTPACLLLSAELWSLISATQRARPEWHKKLAPECEQTHWSLHWERSAMHKMLGEHNVLKKKCNWFTSWCVPTLSPCKSNKPFGGEPWSADWPEHLSLNDCIGHLHVLLRTPPHPSLGLARLTSSDYTKDHPCSLTLSPANGEPCKRSERGRRMGSRTQLFSSRVTDRPADSVVSAQPSVLRFSVTVLSPHLLRSSCYKPQGTTSPMVIS